MNRPARRLPVLALLLAASAARALAQPSADARLRARADSVTVGAYCSAARPLVADSTLRALMGDEAGTASLALERLCDPRVAALTINQLAADGPAAWAAVARLRRDAYRTAVAQPLDTAMTVVRAALRRDATRRERTRALLGDSAAQAWVRISETAAGRLTQQARDSALARLARYERKLGPGSPRLNAVEVVLNYGAQRWLPGFRASPTRGPSPYEVVAAYSPAWGTVTDRATAVSASEFGLRRYLFGPGFGASGWRGLIRPASWSAGALVVSDRDGALVGPWEGRTRTGAYVAWGALKVGWVPGRRGAVLVARQLQLVPFAF